MRLTNPKFFGKGRELHQGQYMLTLANCMPAPRIPDYGFSETPDEHKSFNLLKLDNGQFAPQPSNRCRFFDPSLSPVALSKPDFQVCTHSYTVESVAKWRLSDTETVDYDGRVE